MSDYEPTTAPTAGDERAIREWRSHVAKSLPTILANAERWRVGLAAFIGVVTASLVIRGPAVTTEMSEGWKWAVILLLLAGVIASIVALWVVLDASAPAMQMQRFDDLLSKWPTLRVREVAVAQRLNRQVAIAKVLMIGSLALMVIGIFLWWVAPAPTTMVTVTSPGGSICGEQLSASGGQIVLREADGRVRNVPFARVQKLSNSDSCP